MITCHDCGLLHRRRPVRPREKARCVRCQAILYRGAGIDVVWRSFVALALIGALLFALSLRRFRATIAQLA